LPGHLYGISFYGDNIQDEWFIVSLLFHISKSIPELLIRTCDSDGEFLLIEAAEILPEWANPDTCENAVRFTIFSSSYSIYFACVASNFIYFFLYNSHNVN
jgi:hypothetical protein